MHDYQDKEIHMKYRLQGYTKKKKIPVGDTFSAPVQTDPGAHPAS
jgi:hypothetical protein